MPQSKQQQMKQQPQPQPLSQQPIKQQQHAAQVSPTQTVLDDDDDEMDYDTEEKKLLSKDKDLSNIMGDQKAILGEIRKNNQVNVRGVFAEQPYQSFAQESEEDPSDAEKKHIASQIIHNHMIKKQMKDAFYQAMWK